MPLDEGLRDWLTVGFDRLVLVVARTVTALNRLLDVLSLIQADRRVQVVFTADPAGSAVFRRGVRAALDELGGAVIDWTQAVDTEFALILAASENDRLHRLRGPILLVSHGFGHQKYYPRGRVVAGLNPARLIRDGRVVPAVIGVSHPVHRDDLAVASPPAAARAEVVGDPALDRMRAGAHRAPGYRAALGGTGRTVVLLASTWGPDSLLGRFPALPETIAAALPVDEYRVLAVLHPGVWAAHSTWQVRAWLSRATEAGVRVVDPRHWQAAVVAAHVVVSDQGSLALYAAALGTPLLLTEGTAAHTVTGSALAELAAIAPRLAPRGDLRAQLDAVRAAAPPAGLADLVTRTVPERSAALRAVLHRLLRLPDTDPADYPPPERPAPEAAGWTALVASATVVDGVPHLRRTPALRHGFPADAHDFRHLVADVDTASIRELAAATVLVGPTADPDLLAQWPDSRLIATRLPDGGCRLAHAGGVLTATVTDPPAGFDPTVLASAVYLRLAGHQPLTGVFPVAVGNRVLTVRVAAS